MLWGFFQNHLFSIASLPPFSLSPSVAQKCTVELSVQCVQRSANICACPYLSCSPWALLSALLEVFPEHSHRVTLEKKTETQLLATAQLNLFTLNHPPSSPVAGWVPWELRPRGQGRRTGPARGPAAPAPRGIKALHPHGTLVTKASPHPSCSSSGRDFQFPLRLCRGWQKLPPPQERYPDLEQDPSRGPAPGR